WCSCCPSLLPFSCSCRSNPSFLTTRVLTMMRRVFCVLLALTLLCCCSCAFAVEGKKKQEPQVTQLKAECTDDGNVSRWQLPGKSLWYNCTDAAADFGKMICDMVAGNCAPEVVQRRVEGNAEDGVFEFKDNYFTPSRMKDLWERNVERKPATVASGTSKPLEAGTLGPQEHKAPGDTSTTDPESSPAVAEASQASDSAPSGQLQGAAHSTSAASESPPDPEPTESGEHSSHDPPVELQEENAAAPPTQLSQTGEDGGAAGGTEEDACFHGTRLHALPLLFLAVL
ncbi:90 kDa surface protein, putative, partial [Trypanosoma cruzi]